MESKKTMKSKTTIQKIGLKCCLHDIHRKHSVPKSYEKKVFAGSQESRLAWANFTSVVPVKRGAIFVDYLSVKLKTGASKFDICDQSWSRQSFGQKAYKATEVHHPKDRPKCCLRYKRKHSVRKSYEKKIFAGLHDIDVELGVISLTACRFANFTCVVPEERGALNPPMVSPT